MLVNRCRQAATYCDLVTWAPNGSVLQTRILYQNPNRLRTSGFDIETNYHLPFSGRAGDALDFNFLATCRIGLRMEL